MMKKLWKRNAVVAAVLLLVCAAIYFNGRYAAEVSNPGGVPAKTQDAAPEDSTKILGQATLVDEIHAQEAAEVSGKAEGSDYFASARLARQQARDNALSLLQEASESENVDAAVASEAAQSIQTLAGYTLAEAQIENMITAKGYADCVVFLNADSASVVVSASEDGLQSEDVAKITDIVKQETGLQATAIKILEVN